MNRPCWVIGVLASMLFVAGAMAQDVAEQDALHIESAPATVSEGLSVVGQAQFGSPQWDYGEYVVIAPDGGILIAGEMAGAIVEEEDFVLDGRSDVFVAKYTPAGERLWVRQFSGGSNSTDNCGGLAVDAAGDIYVTGHTSGVIGEGTSAGRTDGFVVKLTGEGEDVWIRMFGTDQDDLSHEIAMGEEGVVYIAGTTRGLLQEEIRETYSDQGRRSRYDVFLVRMNTDGEIEWFRQIGLQQDDYLTAMAVDSLGQPVILGETQGRLGDQHFGDRDIFVAKFSAEGEQLWLEQYGLKSRDRADALAIDADDTCYVVLRTPRAPEPGEFASWEGEDGPLIPHMLLLDPDGNWMDYWVIEAENLAEIAAIIPVDGETIWLGGATVTDPETRRRTSWDVAVMQYDVWGNALQTHTLGTYWDDAINDMAVDSEGRFWLTGDTVGDLAGPYQGDRSEPSTCGCRSAHLPYDVFLIGVEIALPVEE